MAFEHRDTWCLGFLWPSQPDPTDVCAEQRVRMRVGRKQGKGPVRAASDGVFCHRDGRLELSWCHSLANKTRRLVQRENQASPLHRPALGLSLPPGGQEAKGAQVLFSCPSEAGSDAKGPCAGISSLGMRSVASLPCSGQVALRSLLPQGKPEARVPFGAAGDPRRGRAGEGVVQGDAQLPALPRPWGGCDLTVVQGPLQDGRVAGAPVADAREGQHLDLIQHVLAQACELGAAGRVPFHQPEPRWGVRVLLLV